jgi:hypothetical protein
MEKIHSLEQFNEMFRDYIRSYNTTHHSGIDSTPFERYQNSDDVIRKPESLEWVEECFLNRIWRKVRKDSTVSINKVSYDVPMQFISQKVEIRYRPDDMDHAMVCYEDAMYPIRKTDKNENCYTKRQNPPAIDYSKMGGAAHV